MSSVIGVIPTFPLNWELLKTRANTKIEVNEISKGYLYKIEFRGKLFNFRNSDSRKDFKIHPPIEYLDEKRSNLIDIESLSRGWESVGCSYYIAPEGEYEDADFVDLVAIIAETTQGIILNINSIWSWSFGLSTPQELISRSSALR
ncbi:hypothetical protein H8K35_02895 [Undibacterium sp. LX40W]|uniref:Uncharacterized protein n=1 Tax=Undibacterium nitidum TaxID=2762298 RepID=A0A923KSW0_9BURK|nr:MULTISPECIES: hypothetical protein [Undibacterium]MBC3880667.1 hypothetical protein [Undibacterium nitidum]MBC3890597.1 hypothetical protein [Undibacterium sp. LX40W]